MRSPASASTTTAEPRSENLRRRSLLPFLRLHCRRFRLHRVETGDQRQRGLLPFANDAGTRALLANAFSHGPGKTVPLPARARPGPRPTGTGVPLAALAASGPFGAALIRVLRLALAPQRFEPWNAYNDHRMYPSPLAAFVFRHAASTCVPAAHAVAMVRPTRAIALRLRSNRPMT